MTKKTCLFCLFLFSVITATIYFVNNFVVADEIPDFIELKGHTYDVNFVAFSPDGKTVVTTSGDQTARIWDAATGKELQKLEGHTDRVNFAVFSPDGKTVVTASRDQTTRIWDAATGKKLQKLKKHILVCSTTFSPDGKMIITENWNDTADIWDVTTGDVILEGISAAFSPDGKTIVTASSNTARIWDAATRKELQNLEGHTNDIRSATFSPNGKKVVTASDDKTVRIWDATTGQELQKFEHTYSVRRVEFSPDGKMILSLSMTPDSAHTSREMIIRIWDVATGKIMRIWDVATGKEQKLENTYEVHSVKFSPNSEMIVSKSTGHWESAYEGVWEVATGKKLQKLKGYSTMLSPDCKTILTCNDRNVLLWDVATGKELRQLEGHTGKVNSAAFSFDGKKVVTASGNTAWIWNWDMIRQREEQTQKKWLAAGLTNLSEYLTEAGFERGNELWKLDQYGTADLQNQFKKENELWKLAQYGTADLQNQFKKADEFDKPALKKQIATKQSEIKSKKFVLILPYTTTALEVNDTNSQVELIVQIPLFVSKIEEGIDRRGDDLITNIAQIFTTEVGEYNADRKLYSTRSSFLTKDGKIRMCDTWEVTKILNNNGVVYWEETCFSDLHILVSDKTETIKKLVRQKENYNVEVRFANLFWGRPKYFGWFEHQALKKFKSTESLRKMQEF
jgi:WD40 repeat protein